MIDNRYWVIPGRWLAGEYPGSGDEPTARARIDWLLGEGIDAFVDLTEPDELAPYDTLLPSAVDYLRRPITDHGLPAARGHMETILADLAALLREGRRVYLHCRAGIGRTGTVVGCWLAQQGHAGEAAIEELNRLWSASPIAQIWPSVPETSEQRRYVIAWTEPEPVAPAADPAPARAAPELDPAALEAARLLRERFQGALLGLATGDALAAATQYRRPGSFAPIGDLVGGGPFDLPRGAWTDDTAMALCLAESLLERGDFDPRDQVSRYIRWQRDGHLSATGQCVGITASVAKALATAQWRRQRFAGSHDPMQLDPEPLVRVTPVVLHHFADRELAIRLASDAARTTCQAPLVVDACRLLAAMVHAALSGADRPGIRAAALDIPGPPVRAEVTAILDQDLRRKPAALLRPRGDVLAILEAALVSFESTHGFREGALFAANLGGDCDVVAAVFGQLGGAYHGVSAIPGVWRNSLMRKDLLEEFADRLLAHALERLGDG